MYLDALVEQYKTVEPMPVDTQLLHICTTSEASQVPVVPLLRQYKYCRLNSQNSQSYKVLKDAIERLYGTALLNRLEAVK